jgi:hypothetical protein
VNGTSFGAWNSLDTLLISGAPQAFTSNNGLPFGGSNVINVFMRRQDGKLVQKRFDGANWQAVQDLGANVL